MDLDTKAPCSIIEEETWMMLRRPTLRLTVVTLQVYGTCQKLRTLGSCRLEMQLNVHKEKVDVFVIQAPGYPSLKAKIENDLQRLVDMGVLQPITRSEWASLIADWYPLPSNKDFFAILSGGTVFSRLDLPNAYLKIEMEETAKKCTKHTMERITAGLEGMNCYLDDITVFGSSTKEHDERLFNLLKRLYAECFRLKASKHRSHQMLQRNVVCLGWLTTITSIVFPLYALLHENVAWSWKTACDKAWKALRTALISLDVLMHYNSELPVRLECDACGYGIGAALSHVLPHGSHHPIAFASKTLSKAEKNYSQIERKALAPVFGVQKFHRYLFRRTFILVTDYKPLLLDFGLKGHITSVSASRLHRWMLPPRQLCPLLSWTTKEVREQTRQDMAMSYIWWPRLDEDVELLAKTCTTCEVNQADPERSLVHPWAIPEKPWQRLHMDFCGPMFNRIWLVVIDAMTKWPEGWFYSVPFFSYWSLPSLFYWTVKSLSYWFSFYWAVKCLSYWFSLSNCSLIQTLQL
ncbi:Transposon Tf2-6 polyprotein [Trichinella britovi]|uniref:Transposon Tf2-6 polyprotein n=1 Tax=Trichinella britovi TaxID=45882 RepID=A0A0V1CAX5_TRIBR|nr:Transposon Tf2-6 polyprotein [Trichinella britovi]